MSLELRPHQVRGLDGLRAGFAAGHRAQILCGPCAFGKTELAIAMMQASSAKYKRSAMILDRIVLCDQTSARLDKYGIDHGVLQAGHWRRRPYERIQVCSAQTLEKIGTFPDLDLLIVDEAHTQREQTSLFIRNNPHIKVVGLTATPFTKGLGNTYTNVVCSATTDELVKASYLTPLRVYIAKEIDMTGAAKVAGEWSSKESAERGIKITGDVVAEWVKKTHEIFGGPRKTIVFSANVAHAANLSEAFAAAGYNFISLSYKDDDDFKREVIEDFAKADTSIHGVIATDILTKGFDVPDVMIGISARPFSKSLSSHIQQMGRIMRPFPGKEFAVWLDHAGNYLRFREDWDDIYHRGVHTLDDGREKPKKEPTERDKERAKCPKCGSLWQGKTDLCIACGYKRKLRDEVIAAPGEMVELGAAPSRGEKQAWYSQLAWIAQDRGYSDGWIAHQYREKFGVWPRGLDERPEVASLKVANWVRSRQIALGRAQKKLEARA